MNPPLILNNAALPCSLLPIRGQEFPILAAGTQAICPPAIILPQPTTATTTLPNGLCCGGNGGGGGGGLSINNSAPSFSLPHNNLTANCLPITAQTTSGTIFAADPRLTNHLGGNMLAGGSIIPPGSLLYAHSAVVIPGGTGSHSIEVISPQTAIYLAATAGSTGGGGLQPQAPPPPPPRCDPIPIGHPNEKNTRQLGQTLQPLLQPTNSTTTNTVSQSASWKESAAATGPLTHYGYCGSQSSVPSSAVYQRPPVGPRQEERADCIRLSPTVGNFVSDNRELSPSPSPRAVGQQPTPGDTCIYGSCSSGTFCRDFRSAYLTQLLKGDEGQADVSALECADLGETDYAQALSRRLNVQQDITCSSSSRLVGTKGQPQTPNADTASHQTSHHQHDSVPAVAAAAARHTAKCKMVMKTKPATETAWRNLLRFLLCLLAAGDRTEQIEASWGHLQGRPQYNRQEAEDVVSPPVSELLSQTSVFPGSKMDSELFRDLTCGSAAAAAASVTTSTTCWRPGKNCGSVSSTVLAASPPSVGSLTCDTFPPRLAAAAASAGGQVTDTYPYLRNPLIFQSHCNTSGLGSGGSSRCPPERPGSGSTSSSPGRPEKLAGYLNKNPDEPITSPVAGMTASGDTTRRNA
ncbi:hypothetical protein SprV_0200921500 [Sparganum proliferum]